MSRTSDRKNQLLLIAGRVQGIPKICFGAQPIGKIPGHMERADVCGSMTPNALKAVVRLKLVSQPTLEAIGFSNVDRGE
jgi:hypothetical protein